MSKHTPTPWASWNDHVIIPAAHDGRKIGGSSNPAEDRNDFAHEICRIGRNRNHFTADQASANAAFIVKACNSHDRLVAALRVLVDNGGIGPEDMFREARAALAAAGEGYE